MITQTVVRLLTPKRTRCERRHEVSAFETEAELERAQGNGEDDGHDDNDIILDVDIGSCHEEDEPMRSVTIMSALHPRDWWKRLKQSLVPKISEEELRACVPNYRYTPILSGVVIPFAILLEIPGLTEHWYIRTVDNEVVENVPNTLILKVGLGLSMACALLANIFLIIRFLGRKIKLMTIMCIVFLSIHDIINIVAVTVFGVQHRFSDGYTYGQSFWVTVCSTIASTFTNVTLVYDLVHTPNFANSGSGLTRKQRALVIIVMILFVYIALGALGNSLIQDLTFIDGLYLTICTIETIGFGDILPKSLGAKVFICIYAIFGVLNLAVVIAMFRETILEGLEVSYRKRLRKLRHRRRETARRRRIEQRWENAIAWRLNAQGSPVWLRDSDGSALSRTFFDKLKYLVGWDPGTSKYGHRYGMCLNLRALDMPHLEAAAMEAGVPLAELLPEGFEGRDEPDCGGGRPAVDTGMPLTHVRLGRMIAMLGAFAMAVHGSPPEAENGEPSKEEVDAFNANLQGPEEESSLLSEYESFRTKLEKEERKAALARLTVAWALFLVFWTIGSTIFMATEGWTYGTAMYFCFIAFTTIGYGDYSPATPAGRSVFVVWAILGVGTMTVLISCLSDGLFKAYSARTIRMHVFDKLVRGFRDRSAEKHSAQVQAFTVEINQFNQSLPHAEAHVQTKLEALPSRVLTHAKTLEGNLRYFMGQGVGAKQVAVPDSLNALLDEIVGPDVIGQRIRDEILQDEEARQTLFTLSIEAAMKQMVELAESSLRVIAQRDALAAELARLTKAPTQYDLTELDREDEG